MPYFYIDATEGEKVSARNKKIRNRLGGPG